MKVTAYVHREKRIWEDIITGVGSNLQKIDVDLSLLIQSQLRVAEDDKVHFMALVLMIEDEDIDLSVVISDVARSSPGSSDESNRILANAKSDRLINRFFEIAKVQGQIFDLEKEVTSLKRTKNNLIDCKK